MSLCLPILVVCFVTRVIKTLGINLNSRRYAGERILLEVKAVDLRTNNSLLQSKNCTAKKCTCMISEKFWVVARATDRTRHP